MRVLIVIALACFGLNAFAVTECRDEIKNRVFISENGGDSQKATDQRIIGQFEAAYDLMPKALHPFFCAFQSFQLLRPYDATADSGMDFRAGLFDKAFDASRWLTWKEQLNYGTPNNDEFPLIAGLPVVEATVNGNAIPFLLPVLVHEMAHNLDRSGDFQERWDARHEKYAANLPEADSFCFYWCDETSVLIKPEQSEDLFRRMYTKTDWINAYSRISEEDFADSFAYYTLIQKNGEGSDYKLKLPGGTEYSIRSLMQTPLYAEKMALLAEAYASLPTDSSRVRFRKGAVIYVQ